MISIDGVEYDVGVIKITRKATQKIESLGTTMDLRKHYDVKGTYYDYEVTLGTTHMNVNAYDNLYEVLTTPRESHRVVLPYGQQTLSFEARISVASDSLITSFSRFKKWGTLKVTFEALTPQKEG